MGDCARLTESGLTRACGDIIPYRGNATISPHISPTKSPTKRAKRCKFFYIFCHFALALCQYMLNIYIKHYRKGNQNNVQQYHSNDNRHFVYSWQHNGCHYRLSKWPLYANCACRNRTCHFLFTANRIKLGRINQWKNSKQKPQKLSVLII